MRACGCQASPRWRGMPRNVIMLCLVFIVASAVGACAAATTPLVRQTPTLPPATSVATPALPTLGIDAGYHSVLDLRNTPNANPNNGEVLSGSFFASKQYTILLACMGSGKVEIAYAPQGTYPYTCTPTPRITSVHVGTQQNPPAMQQIQVTVTSSGAVTWQMRVEIQN